MSHIIVNLKYYSLKEQNTPIGQFNTRAFVQNMEHQICQFLQSIFIKVPMKWKTIAAYLKGFSKYIRMEFSFSEYLVSF